MSFVSLILKRLTITVIGSSSFICFSGVDSLRNGVVGCGFAFPLFDFLFSSMAAPKVFLVALGG